MLNDDLLGAYLDGELDADKRALVEHWLATDNGAATRLERMRNADTLIQRALPRLAAEANDPIAAMIMGQPSGVVVSFRQRIARPWVRQLAAVAAACVIGVLAGRWSAPQTSAFSAGMYVDADLQRVLDRVPSGARAPILGGELQMAQSLRGGGGEVCREFRVTSGRNVADALACQDGGRWRVIAQAAQPSEQQAYQSASAGVSPIEAAMSGLGSVVVLDAGEEAALIDSHWRQSR